MQDVTEKYWMRHLVFISHVWLSTNGIIHCESYNLQAGSKSPLTGTKRPRSGAKRPVSGWNVQGAKRPGGETSSEGAKRQRGKTSINQRVWPEASRSRFSNFVTTLRWDHRPRISTDQFRNRMSKISDWEGVAQTTPSQSLIFYN